MEEIHMKEVKLDVSEVVTLPLMVTLDHFAYRGVSFAKGEFLIPIYRTDTGWILVR